MAEETKEILAVRENRQRYLKLYLSDEGKKKLTRKHIRNGHACYVLNKQAEISVGYSISYDVHWARNEDIYHIMVIRREGKHGEEILITVFNEDVHVNSLNMFEEFVTEEIISLTEKE